MISETDFEKLWFSYQTDGVQKDVSINQYCLSRGVPYNEFEKWFRKTHRSVVKVEVEGVPDDVTAPAGHEGPGVKDAVPTQRKVALRNKGIRVTIQTPDGMHIRKGGLDYDGLRLLVERLEGVC